MSTIAQVKDQVNRIWYASFQTDPLTCAAMRLRVSKRRWKWRSSKN